jgi:HEPN domain-containing protein
MHANSARIAVAREWVIKAENDLKNAAHTLKLGRACPTDTVGFHAQQCVEKYLKAFLVCKGIDFPRTHDIERLVALLPYNLWLRLSIEEQRRLTIYATVTRYPGDYEPIPLTEAQQSVRLARRIRKEIQALLPKAALQHPKK